MKCKECELPAAVLGWCNGHYTRQRLGRPMEGPIRGTGIQPCASGCGRDSRRGSTLCKVCYTKEWHARQGECRLGHCHRRINADELCTTHYNRRRRGLPDWDAEIPERMKRGGTCQHKDGCPEPAYARGWCIMHYQRVTQLGYADGGPVGRLKAADGEGGDDGRGYRNITVNGRKMLEHRWVMEQQHGRPLLPGENVHHKNGMKADNRPENLELWVKVQPAGQRVEDLVAFVVEHYPAEVRQALNGRRGPL